MRLSGKVAVIAGAGGRQGTAVPLLFAREGAKLVLAARDVDELDRLSALIRERGGEAVARRADLTIEDDARAAVKLASDTYGSVVYFCSSTSIST